MRASQIAFYTTVATVIPVFLLAYVAQAVTLARKGIEFGFTLVEDMRGFASSVARLFRKRYKATLIGRIRAGLFLTVMVLPIGAGLLFLIGGPVVGEYFALHALVADRSTSEATDGATVGLAASAVPVLAPAVYVVLVLPIIKTVRHLKATRALEREARKASDADGAAPASPADGKSV